MSDPAEVINNLTYFQRTFKVVDELPIAEIVFAGVEYDDLRNLLEFIYNGEMKADESRLEHIISLATFLEIQVPFFKSYTVMVDNTNSDLGNDQIMSIQGYSVQPTYSSGITGAQPSSSGNDNPMITDDIESLASFIENNLPSFDSFTKEGDNTNPTPLKVVHPATETAQVRSENPDQSPSSEIIKATDSSPKHVQETEIRGDTVQPTWSSGVTDAESNETSMIPDGIESLASFLGSYTVELDNTGPTPLKDTQHPETEAAQVDKEESDSNLRKNPVKRTYRMTAAQLSLARKVKPRSVDPEDKIDPAALKDTLTDTDLAPQNTQEVNIRGNTAERSYSPGMTDAQSPSAENEKPRSVDPEDQIDPAALKDTNPTTATAQVDKKEPDLPSSNIIETTDSARKNVPVMDLRKNPVKRSYSHGMDDAQPSSSEKKKPRTLYPETEVCQFCRRQFKDVPKHEAHCRKNEQTVILQCQICNKTFSRQEAFDKHVNTAHLPTDDDQVTARRRSAPESRKRTSTARYASTSPSAASEQQKVELVCRFCQKIFIRINYLPKHELLCKLNPDRGSTSFA